MGVCWVIGGEGTTVGRCGLLGLIEKVTKDGIGTALAK